MAVREKFVRSGDWRTLETFWNVTTTAWFQKPAGAEVKIRYSGWWFGADRQRQRLDGSTVKRLVISRWSVFTARLQIRVTNDTAVIYVVEAGDVANLPPTFQQVQKYENGANRVSISRLIQFCEALDVPPSQVLDGLSTARQPKADPLQPLRTERGVRDQPMLMRFAGRAIVGIGRSSSLP